MRKPRRPAPLLPIGKWKPGYYLIAYGDFTTEIYGRTNAGLGITMSVRPSPAGVRPAEWSLTHLGSGHRVCIIAAAEVEAFAIADDIAGAGDWSFDGLFGWQNRDPELMDRLGAILVRHGKCLSRAGSGQANENAARLIVEARA